MTELNLPFAEWLREYVYHARTVEELAGLVVGALGCPLVYDTLNTSE